VARYLDAVIASHVRRGHGPVRVRAELEQQGLDREAITAALTDCGVDFAALAAEVRSRKFGAGSPRDFGDRARQLRFLQYRGFSPEDCRRAVGAGSGSDDPGDD
jgi:regulatory protein